MTDRTPLDWANLLVPCYTKYPSALQISGEGNHIAIKSHRADYGKLVGRGGTNIKALSTLLSAIMDRTISVVVLDPITGRVEAPERFDPDRNWTNKKQEGLHDLLSRVCSAIFQECTVLAKDGVGGMSAFQVTAHWMTPEVEHALYTIFRAIGNSRGRKVSVEGRSGEGK